MEKYWDLIKKRGSLWDMVTIQHAHSLSMHHRHITTHSCNLIAHRVKEACSQFILCIVVSCACVLQWCQTICNHQLSVWKQPIMPGVGRKSWQQVNPPTADCSRLPLSRPHRQTTTDDYPVCWGHSLQPRRRLLHRNYHPNTWSC